MIYSLDKINEMAEGDDEFIVSVISVFLEEVPADIEALGIALEEMNYNQVYNLAHKIKPNVDLLGMEQTRAIALEIETLGKNKAGIEEMKKVFPILKTDIAQVVSELKKDFNL
ncbi:Hpt domain-containing protein [Maribacter sp.]|uniref:Hpt domain-containing protein n=1 Tax=Maribacter sp. TaxID=1897614 RepID=UPI0025B9F6EF|nr:Hpt domain-containing protein [Maribacter sp.]